MGDTLDLKQIFFTNLQLLGFDAGAEEAKNKIPFNKSMFDLPNKRGAEIVLHFLFNRLNPVMCREEFRDCWPILDKKCESQFRRSCHNWLVNISKDEPDSHLPRIAASLFMSPGGNKFYQLLFHFSTYILQQVILKENEMKEKDYLRYPILTQQNVSLGDVMAKAVQCGIVRERKKFIEEAQVTLVLNTEWKEYANELVKDYRHLSKEVREIDHDMRTEVHTASEKGIARGSPMVKRTKSRMYEYDFDPQSIKRSQRVQEVRDMWKQLDEFYTREAAEREVIESIVDRTLNQHRIDAGEINIKVPDLLLRECEEEIRRRHVDNTFQSGKLNLVSLVQLWNLCLHLYIERMHQVGVPKFDADIKKISNQVHTNNAYLANAKTMRTKMAEVLPELKKSVEDLQTRIDSSVSITTTPQTIRTTSLGLGLVEPSPPVSFTPSRGTTGQTPRDLGVSISPDDVSTPEAAARIADGISTSVKIGPKKLFQGSPVYAPRIGHEGQPKGKNKIPTKISKSTKYPARTVDVRKQLQSTPTKAYTKEIVTMEKEPQSWMSQQAKRSLAKKTSNFENGIESLNSSKSSKSGHSLHSEDEDVTLVNSSGRLSGDETPVNRSHQSDNQSRHSDKSARETPRKGVRRSPSDIVADEVMGEGNVLSPVRSGREAFVSHDMVKRSPETSKSPRSPSDVFVDQMLARTPTSTTKSRVPEFVSKHLNGSPVTAEAKKLWQECVSAENSPRSFKSQRSHKSKSSDHSQQFQSPRSSQKSRSPRSPLIQKSTPDRKVSRRKDIQPEQKYEFIGNHVQERPPSPVAEILDSFHDDEERPHAPVAEILNSYQDDEERPHSPVAEILDSLDKIPSAEALTTLNKQEEVLSDLNSPRSDDHDASYHGNLNDEDGGYDEDKQEVPEIYKMNMDKSTQSPRGLNSLIRVKDQMPRSPVPETIRMIKEALAKTENVRPNSAESSRSRTYLMRDNYTESNVFGLDSDQLSGSDTTLQSESAKQSKEMKFERDLLKSKKELDFKNDTKSDISLDEILRRQNLSNELLLEDENLDDIEMPDLCSNGTFDEIFETLIRSKRTVVSPKLSSKLGSLKSSEFDSIRTGSLGDKVPKKQKFPLVDVDFEEVIDTELVTVMPDRKEIIKEHKVISYNDDGGVQERDYDQVIISENLNSDDLQNENFLFSEGQDNESKSWRNKQRNENDDQGFGLEQETVESELLEDIEFLNDSNNSILKFDLDFKTNEINDSKGSEQKSEEDLDLLESLDDSFVPLKGGFQLAGTTPVKTAPPSHKSEPKKQTSEDDSLLARFQKLKQITSQIQKEKLGSSFGSGDQ